MIASEKEQPVKCNNLILFACVVVAMRSVICFQLIFFQVQNYGFIALPVIAKIKLILIFIYKTNFKSMYHSYHSIPKNLDKKSKLNT